MDLYNHAKIMQFQFVKIKAASSSDQIVCKKFLVITGTLILMYIQSKLLFQIVFSLVFGTPSPEKL